VRVGRFRKFAGLSARLRVNLLITNRHFAVPYFSQWEKLPPAFLPLQYPAFIRQLAAAQTGTPLSRSQGSRLDCHACKTRSCLFASDRRCARLRPALGKLNDRKVISGAPKDHVRSSSHKILRLLWGTEFQKQLLLNCNSYLRVICNYGLAHCLLSTKRICCSTPGSREAPILRPSA
jgi:hypothetical protein